MVVVGMILCVIDTLFVRPCRILANRTDPLRSELNNGDVGGKRDWVGGHFGGYFVGAGYGERGNPRPLPLLCCAPVYHNIIGVDDLPGAVCELLLYAGAVF